MDFNFVVKTKQDYANFIKYLKSISKGETIEDKVRHIAILNTKQDVIGITMANIRKTAKQIFKNGYQDFLDICLGCDYKQELYEETLIQGLVIAEIKDLAKQKELLSVWVHKIDNWSTCDSVVSTMKSLKNSTDKNKYFDFYLNLCFSKKEFVSRFGIIVLMVNYLENEYIDQILDMCKKVKSEHYYVKMGVAWLVSFAFIKFKDKTKPLLESRVLDKFTQNKSISKCRDSYQVSKEDKDLLVAYRIK